MLIFVHRKMEKNNISKTNVARLLDAAGISYELIPYEYSEDDLSAVSQ